MSSSKISENMHLATRRQPGAFEQGPLSVSQFVRNVRRDGIEIATTENKAGRDVSHH